MAPLQDDDLLLIQRGSDHYKTTYKQLKEQIASDLTIPIRFLLRIRNKHSNNDTLIYFCYVFTTY